MPRRKRLSASLFLSLSWFCQNVVGQESTATILGNIDQPEFTIMGFGDVSYVSEDGSDPDGFAIGQAVAHLSASLGDSLSVFGEFSATAKDSGYVFEVERAIVKYDFSDTFKLSAGRYHTPIGYWNSAFHHGAWLQTTVSRPEMVKFGSSIVPIHFVSVLLEGGLPVADEFGIEYKVGLGNGRHANIARAGDAGDINGDNAWMAQISTRPRRLSGLSVGAGIYQDLVSPPDSPDVDESTVSAYVAWTRGAPEVIVEYIHSTHELASNSSVSGDVNAWYAQFAYRLPGNRSDWKPYVRAERNDVDNSDPLLGAAGLDYEGAILGVRWDFNSYAALKAEYRNEEFDNGGRENNFRLQIAVVLAKL
ncbi:MAG: hypothetical protein ACWGPN_13815 [Gammaproteobacteria bacterium]